MLIQISSPSIHTAPTNSAKASGQDRRIREIGFPLLFTLDTTCEKLHYETRRDETRRDALDRGRESNYCKLTQSSGGKYGSDGTRAKRREPGRWRRVQPKPSRTRVGFSPGLFGFCARASSVRRERGEAGRGDGGRAAARAFFFSSRSAGDVRRIREGLRAGFSGWALRGAPSWLVLAAMFFPQLGKGAGPLPPPPLVPLPQLGGLHSHLAPRRWTATGPGLSGPRDLDARLVATPCGRRGR